MSSVLIAHRGNLTGPHPEVENSLDYVDRALNRGFDVEIDLWGEGGSLFLGHDQPQYPVSINWLENRLAWLWVHCKNRGALEVASETALNWFFHDSDAYTVTSQGYIWSYPGSEPVGKKCVALWFGPEDPTGSYSSNEPFAICGDYVDSWRPR